MNNLITAIVLSHYKEREGNLKRIVNDLLSGTVKPDNIVLFIDNPEINYEDDRITVICSSKSFLPRIRFVLGSYFESAYCFFIDDDLTVREKTLENFISHANGYEILGLEGSILGSGPMPYANDTSINRRDVDKPTLVDVIIRTYFVPIDQLTAGIEIMQMNPDLPCESLDDVYLCLGAKYLNYTNSFVIPVDDKNDLYELDEAGVGQSRRGIHYENRNIVCRMLREQYEKNYRFRS